MTGTAEQSKAVEPGSISSFGTYTVEADNSLTIHIIGGG
jgi:hypothetical protein